MKECVQFRTGVEVKVVSEPPSIEVKSRDLLPVKFSGPSSLILCELLSEGSYSRTEIVDLGQTSYSVPAFSSMMMLSSLDGIHALQTQVTFPCGGPSLIIDETTCTDHLSGGSRSRSPVATTPYAVSRYHLTRFDSDEWITETCHGDGRIRCAVPAILKILGLFHPPSSIDDVVTRVGAAEQDWCTRVCLELVRARVLVPLGVEDQPRVRMWDFHDLLSHSRSRIGRTVNPGMELFRFKDDKSVPPLPQEVVFDGDRTQLRRPDRKDLAGSRPLADVMRTRRSQNVFPESGLKLAQLGEFLFRCNANIDRAHPGNDVLMANRFLGENGFEFIKKIYPSAGCIYEIELFVVVRNCDGLLPGLYFHDAQSHELVSIREMDPAVEKLLQLPRVQGSLPAALVLLVSRFGRLSYKYESFAYALTLKNAGVLTAYMYLVAEDLGLSACAYGTGDAELFSKLTGTNWYDFAYVADFGIGSRSTVE